MATMLGLAPQAAYRNGGKLEVPRGATLPSYCVKCGQPADGEALRHTFTWHSPVIFLTILVGVLIYVIVAMIVRKKMELAVPLCATHKARRKTLLWIGLALLLSPLAALFALPTLSDDAGGIVILLSFPMFLVGLIVISPLRAPMVPKFIDETRGTFKGAGEAFLNMLPSGPGSG